MTALTWVAKTYRYEQRVFWRVPQAAFFTVLLPVTFVIAPVTVNAFPKSANPPVLRFNHGTLNPLMSFVLVCRVTPLKINALPLTGNVPPQLVRFDQFPLAPAPLHVRGPEFQVTEKAS